MDQLVVQAIVTIERGLGKKTVAKFVVEPETASLLRTIGVDCAQGYFIGEPRPTTEILPGTIRTFSGAISNGEANSRP